MILASSQPEARSARWRNQKPGNTLGLWCTPYFGLMGSSADGRPQPRIGTLYPVAFQIESDPGYETRPHFHVANQFQVFVRGGGSIGKTALHPVSVHYAAAYTPYGPLRADANGLTYFTLRNGYDPGNHYMPQSREELKAAGRRPRVASADAVADFDAPVTGVGEMPACTAVIGPHDDGLAAWLYRVPAGASVEGPAPRAGGGQHWFVLSGAGELDEIVLATTACVFCSPDEPARRVTAGPGGLEVLALQFPAFR